jgi:hypothetical protein
MFQMPQTHFSLIKNDQRELKQAWVEVGCTWLKYDARTKKGAIERSLAITSDHLRSPGYAKGLKLIKIKKLLTHKKTFP